MHFPLDRDIGEIAGQASLFVLGRDGTSEERLAADPGHEVVTERECPYARRDDAGIVHRRRVRVDIGRARSFQAKVRSLSSLVSGEARTVLTSKR